MQKPNYRNTIKSRSDILTLLTEACELEHGLACSYLYAGFSLKQDLEEGGMSWEQLHKVKKWAAQIYLVASQEMFHLSQAWNIINALGGTAYYFRPNFPQGTKYYPIGLPLTLEPFSEKTMNRFILYELPREIDQKHFLKSDMGFVDEDLYDYKTVGELYEMIGNAIKDFSETGNLFIGDPSLQLGEDDIDFPEIVKVIDTESALEAISKITEQGEGNLKSHENGHYEIFQQILKEYLDEVEACGSCFKPVRNVIFNPVVHIKGDYRTNRGELITDPFSAEIADIFDDLYNLMLRILKFIFSTPDLNPELKKRLSKFSIATMPMIIKPLGDALMLLPAGRISPGKKAGPAFSMSRHLSLPFSENAALIVIKERYQEIVERLELLALARSAPPQLISAVRNSKILLKYL